MTSPQLPPPSGVPPVPPAPYGALQPPAAPAPPPGAYQVPVGGYAAPVGGYAPTAPPVPQSPLLGILALVFSLVAAVATPILVGVAAFEIGRRIPEAVSYMSDPDLLAVLSPAREQVLWAELSFWAGTVLGIAAIVVGIIAIRRRQGGVQGIVALVLAVLAPVVFFVVLGVTLAAGAASGTAELYI